MDDVKIELLPPGTALAWGHAPSPRRGPKPGYSLDQIVDAAIAQADAEGYAALSMPSIAKRLGITANALYRYLSSKEELLVLVAEAAWGPPPKLSSGDWRAAVTVWARALLDRSRRHPWLIDLPVRTAPSTPNLLGWLENFLEGMDGTGLGTRDVMGCVVLVDGWVRSTATLLRDVNANAPERVQALSEFLRPHLEGRGYPRVAAVISGEAYGEEGVEDDDVEFGLGRILDGIEALIVRR